MKAILCMYNTLKAVFLTTECALSHANDSASSRMYATVHMERNSISAHSVVRQSALNVAGNGSRSTYWDDTIISSIPDDSRIVFDTRYLSCKS